METGDGSLTMFHEGFDEEFHSRSGALTEARELYINRSGFSEKGLVGSPIEILDVGLGLGYNALMSIEAWLAKDSPGDLSIISLEVDESLVLGLASGDADWMKDWNSSWREWGKSLKKVAEGRYKADLAHPSGASGTFVVLVGNALMVHWENEVKKGLSYVWQDAFSPGKNPELWSSHWFKRVAEARAEGGCVLMTYSVARIVRDALAEAGFQVARIPAVGAKRNWLKGVISNH